MSWAGELLRVAVSVVGEQLGGVVRRALRSASEGGSSPPMPLSRADSELQSKYAREAGKYGTVSGAQLEAMRREQLEALHREHLEALHNVTALAPEDLQVLAERDLAGRSVTGHQPKKGEQHGKVQEQEHHHDRRARGGRGHDG